MSLVSSGVDLFVGAIANMLKVDDWGLMDLSGMKTVSAKGPSY